MLKKIIKNILFTFCFAGLTACNGFFEKDNTPPPTPLQTFRPEVTPAQLWSVSTGNGSGGEYLKLNPSMDDVAIYTTSSKGLVTATNKVTGRKIWQINTSAPLSTGPGIGDGIVAVGSRTGDVIILRKDIGTSIWKVTIDGEMLGNPAVGNGLVYAKTVDGYVRALSIADGHIAWAFQETEPTLILRGSSAPVFVDSRIIAGFANGTLAKLNASNGEILWQQSIAVPEGAFAIQRMIDIDADPVVYGHQIYAATYQGKIAALSWLNGHELWSEKISSYTGMSTDGQTIYISDAQGHVYAFDAESGSLKWKQVKLEARGISAPAVVGHYVVVGDNEGYLHWLSKDDGHLSGRVKPGGSIYAAPLVANNVVYAFSSNGNLTAYRMNS